MKNIVIAVLALLVVWLALQVIRLERYHYASQIGICPDANPNDPNALSKRAACLKNSETRTNPLWHLWYGAVDRR